MARRAALAVVTAISIALVAACGDDAHTTDSGATSIATPTATLSSDQLAFEASVAVSTREVVITWTATNTSGKPVLVTNRVADRNGNLSTNPDQTYVLPGDERGEVELAKRVLPVTSDATSDALPWIGVTELGDGETMGETVRVPLPLHVYGPPSPNYGDLMLPDPQTSVVFCIGVISGREPNWGFKQNQGAMTVNHGNAAAGQTTLCSAPVELP